MKKYIFGAILSIGILISPVFVQAAGLTSSQISAIIQLLQSFGVDSATIASVTTALGGDTSGGGGTQPWCHTFNTDLTFGSIGTEVSELNQALKSSSINIADDTRTFNEDTAASVVQFQAKYGIRQTGYVGPITRAKLNASYDCRNSQQLTDLVPTTQAQTVQPATSSNDWIVVFSNRGTEVPQDVQTFICGTALPTAVTWFTREATSYGKTKPFLNATCIDQQVTLSSDLLNGSGMFVEGSNFNSPINADAVINLLEQDGRIKAAKFVTVIHYMENDLPFANFMQNSKYDFGFIRKGASALYYPVLTVDNYSEEFLHEFMHKLGATDKYGGSSTACLTNLKTGSEYSGYDIMCHRIKQSGGYTVPSFSELKVTDPTALEIGWK